MKGRWRFVVPVLFLLATVLLFRFVLFIGYVPTESMEPTISKGSYILGCRIFGELKVGDIIVFEHEGKQVVKRIAAVGGDVVDHMGYSLTVPEDCFYVLGDNEDNSWDSRYWESPFLCKRNIIVVLDKMFTITLPCINNPIIRFSKTCQEMSIPNRGRKTGV